MASVHKHGQMAQVTLDNGKIIKRAVMANLLTSKATPTRANGPSTKLMDTESISTLTGPNTKATGKTIYNTDSGSKLG